MARLPDDSLTDAVWRRTVMLSVENAPFTADRFALYALHLHASAYKPAAIVYFFSKSRRLLSSRVLFAGHEKEPTVYCPDLPDMLAGAGAASLGISLCYPDAEVTDEIIHRLSRIVLFCEARNIPLLEAILVCGENAIPFCRACGASHHTVFHPKGSR